jgi:hypothetical protein
VSLALINPAPLVAAMDLNLVRTLTAGMREVNRRSAAAGGGACPGGAITPRPVIHPTPRIEARPVISPAPRIEPRRVIHPEPLIAPVAPAGLPREAQAPQGPTEPRKPGGIQPPWRVRPWEIPQPPPARPVIKPVVRHVDNVRKGSMLDLFV